MSAEPGLSGKYLILQGERRWKLLSVVFVDGEIQVRTQVTNVVVAS